MRRRSTRILWLRGSIRCWCETANGVLQSSQRSVGTRIAARLANAFSVANPRTVASVVAKCLSIVSIG